MSDPDHKPFPAFARPEGVDPDVLDGAFRETFLSRITDEEPNVTTIRTFGKLLNTFVLESCRFWPYRYIDATANSLKAGVGDLRHLQEFFTNWSEDEPSPKEDPDEVRRHRELWQLSRRAAQTLKELADDIEKEIGDWQFEPRRS